MKFVSLRLQTVPPILPFVLLLGLVFSGCSRQARLSRHLAIADRSFAEGLLDKAEIEYRNVLQYEITNPRAISQLGLIYFQEGRADRAIPFLRKGMSLQPDNVDVMLDLTRIYLSAGNLKAAREGADSVLARRPDDNDAPSLLAETAVFPKDYEAIGQRLHSLAEKAPKNAALVVALGVLEMRQHRLSEAETAFRRALEISPQSRSAHLALGTLLWSRKDLVQADAMLSAAAADAPTRSSERLQFAEFKLQTGDPKAARGMLDKLVQQSPDYIPALLLLAKISVTEKNFDEGRSEIGKVLTRDPGNPEAFLLSAQIKMADGDNKGAIAELERMQKLYPKSANVCYQLAQGYLALGDKSRAVQSLNQALILAPDFTAASVLLAETEIRRREYLSAFLAMKQLVHDRPGFLQAWLLLADAERGLGHLDDAIAVYRQIDRAFPNTAETSLLLGAVLLQQDKREEARQSFNHALEIAPNYLGASEQLIDLDLVEKKYSAATLLAKAAVERHPNQAIPLILLARSHLAQNERLEAEHELYRAVEIQPDSTSAVYLLARLYIATNRQKAALNDLHQILRKDPKAIGALMLIASIDEQQSDFEAAGEAYEQVLKIDPKSGSALNNLAYLYSEKLGRLPQAYELAQRAVEADPSQAHFSDTLGWIEFKRHQYASALHSIQDSATELPQEAEVQFHLAMTQYVMGDEDAARDTLQRVLTIDPEFRDKNLVAHRLAVLAQKSDDFATVDPVTMVKTFGSDSSDPVALVRLGVFYRRQGNSDKAIEAFKGALLANQDFKPALLNLVALYSAIGDFPQALEFAKDARKVDPNDPEIARSLGKLAFKTRDFKWSASLLQEASASLPDNASLQQELGEAAYSVGRIKDATDSTRRAVELGLPTPDLARARRLLEMISLAENQKKAEAQLESLRSILLSDPSYVPALMALGRTQEEPGNSKDGAATYGAVLLQYPDFTPAMKRLAILYARNRADDKKALELAAKARQGFPDDPELSKAFGILIYRSGDFAQAAIVLRETATSTSTDAELFFYLGMAESRLNQRTQSREDLSRALRLNLQPDLTPEAKRVLSELN